MVVEVPRHEWQRLNSTGPLQVTRLLMYRFASPLCTLLRTNWPGTRPLYVGEMKRDLLSIQAVIHGLWCPASAINGNLFARDVFDRMLHYASMVNTRVS